MRNNRWLVMSVGGMLLMSVVGCGQGGKASAGGANVAINHSSERLLVVTLDAAIKAKNYDAIVESFDPNFRGTFKKIVFIAKDYSDNLRSLAALAGQKVGPELADIYSDKAARVMADLMPSPIDGAVENGKVNWDKMLFLDQGTATLVDVVGKDSRFAHQFYLRQIKGEWYVTPRLDKVPPAKQKAVYERRAQDIKEIQTTFNKMVNEDRKKIKSGVVTKDNYREMLFQKSADTDAEPLKNNQP